MNEIKGIQRQWPILRSIVNLKWYVWRHPENEADHLNLKPFATVRALTNEAVWQTDQSRSLLYQGTDHPLEKGVSPLDARAQGAG